MCDGFSEVAAAVGAVAAVAGAGTSYVAGQRAASAANAAQEQAIETQNEGFNARLAAETQDTEDQAAVDQESAAQFTENQAQEQNAQTAALNQNQTVLNNADNQEQAIATDANNSVNQGLAPVSGTGLQDAQAGQVAQQEAMEAPIAANIQASNPLGALDTGPTAGAMAAGNKAASSYVSNYGDTQAELSGYNAPIATSNIAATNIGTNLMPAAAANELVQTGAPALLAPSNVAYNAAGAYGQAAENEGAIDTAAGTTIAQDKEAGAENLANLQQGDQTALTQGELNVAQTGDAALAGVGAGLSTLGNTAIQAGVSKGALSGLTTKTSTAAQQLAAGTAPV
jgi:hypothetical protein